MTTQIETITHLRFGFSPLNMGSRNKLHRVKKKVTSTWSPKYLNTIWGCDGMSAHAVTFVSLSDPHLDEINKAIMLDLKLCHKCFPKGVIIPE